MLRYICIYFSTPTNVYKASDILKKYKVPHKIVKLSQDLEQTGCNQCVLVTGEHKERAVSALNETGAKYLSIKAVERL